MTYKIYLSSTYSDLAEERKVILSHLRREGVLPIQTELASAEPVLERCLKDVEKCDALILLVSASYGTIKENANGEEYSITHHEYLHARRTLKIPVLVFDLDYVCPPADISDQQRKGLRQLRDDIHDLNITVCKVPSQYDLGVFVQDSVRQHLKQIKAEAWNSSPNEQKFAIPTPASSNVSARAPAPAVSPSREMYLQVQLKPSAGCFHLIPEVFLPAPGDGGWQPFRDANPQPRDAVPVPDLVATLDKLCEEAQDCLPNEIVGEIEEVVIELFLPDEELTALLVGGSDAAVLPDLTRLDYPFTLRSLSRAEKFSKARILANKLDAHWRHSLDPKASLLACTRWPSPTLNDNFRHALQAHRPGVSDQEPKAAVTAFVALLLCPAEREVTGDLLQSILRSPLPVVLLWQKDDKDDTDLSDRWSRTSALLERQLPALPMASAEGPADSHLLHPVQLPPGPWCSWSAARRRKSLLGDSQRWVHQAVLLVDCPHRWPRLVAPDLSQASDPAQTSGRYQLRTTPS